jgi:HlyD family secretion protein
MVDEYLKEVQHRDGGTIAAIAVRVGDHVEKDQVLLALDDVQVRAELAIVSGQLLELIAREARLLAERDGLTEIAVPEELSLDQRGLSLIRNETVLFKGNLLNRTRQKEQMELQIGQLGQEITGLNAQKAALDEEIALVEAEREKLAGLAKKGLTEGSRVYAITREVIRMLGERGSIEANLARSQGRISEIQMQMLAVDETARNDAQRELRGLDATISELTERRLAIKDRLAHTEVRAPIAGTINELNVTTVGGVITPAETLATIVPDDAHLKIEIRLRTVDIDQLHVGQNAKLRLSAFNQRTTPEIDGQIVQISAAAQRDPRTGESFYLGDVAITGDMSKMSNIKLLPGMPVEVFVQTAEMTAIAYFAKPFSDQIARAFREE